MANPVDTMVRRLDQVGSNAGRMFATSNDAIAEGFSRMEDKAELGALKAERALQNIEEAITTPKFHLEIERETFQHKLTFVLLLIFGLPCVSCALLSTHPSVSYWIGPAGTRVSIACLMWVLIGQYIVISPNRRILVIQLLILPAISLIVVSHLMKLISLNTSAQLELEDCTVFPSKARVEQAWQEAKTILLNCIDEKVSITQSPREEVVRVTSVQQCAEYQKGLSTWFMEWDYLQRLEAREDCAGWCKPGRPLWHPVDDEQVEGPDRCSLVVAGIMKHEILRTCYQIIAYSGTIVVVLGFLFSMVNF